MSSWSKLLQTYLKHLYTNTATLVAGAVPIHWGEVLSYLTDSIDVARMSKAAPSTAHNAITATATSTEIDCRGYNSLLIKADISVATKLWTFKVQGAMASGATFVDWYEQANTGTMTLMSYQTNASKGWVFRGIPDWVKIVATEDEDGATVSVKVQPFNS